MSDTKSIFIGFYKSRDI